MSTHRENLARALKKARIDAGFRSQADLARPLNLDRSVITKAESPSQALPTRDLVTAWADQTGASAEELTDLLKRCRSGTPEWFMDYLAAEQAATTLRLWGLVNVPGLFQTQGYARALLSVERYSQARLDELVDARMRRQEALDRAYVIAAIDHRVLRDRIGSPAIMAEQCDHLMSLADSDKIRLHVVPEGANVGTYGAFQVASRGPLATVNFVGLRDIPTTAPDVIDEAMRAFEGILAAALPASESLDLIRTWRDTWKAQT